jgi:hypothetical protein
MGVNYWIIRTSAPIVSQFNVPALSYKEYGDNSKSRVVIN